ncbi:hypothetical protein SprV_0200555200 [Sparganum proliferum]
MHSVAMLIGQVSELRQQQAARMNHGQEGMSSSPSEAAGHLTSALSEENYRHQLVTYLCSLGGDTVVSFVDRVFGALFSEQITSFVTFYGQQQGKRPFFGTPLYNLVLGLRPLESRTALRPSPVGAGDKKRLQKGLRQAIEKANECPYEQRSGPSGPQQPRRRRRATMRQGVRWMMNSIAMLICQVSELRQQHAAMMDLLQGLWGMSIRPCESYGFNLRPVGPPEQLDALTNALGDDTYRH